MREVVAGEGRIASVIVYQGHYLSKTSVNYAALKGDACNANIVSLG
jgi:hypothetical protein